jgi:diguanylate cyclase (GGDEF)-like protein
MLFTNAVACICICVSLVLIWRTARFESFIVFWSLGYGFSSAAMLLVALRHLIPNFLPILSPGALLLAAFGAFWFGYRRFAGRCGRLDPFWACLGPLIWLGLSALGGPFDDAVLRSQVNEVLEIGYLAAIAIGLIRLYRADPTTAIGLTIALLIVHIVKLTIEVWALGSITDPSGVILLSPVFFGFGLVETSVFAVFLGLLQLVLIGQRSQRRFRIAAETDALTGLANRRHFLDSILPRLAAARDRGALILFDIDHFKRVNDTYGHPAGDRALARFAATLTAAAPACALTARLGGEEFALFLPNGTLAEATGLADRIRRDIADLRVATRAGDLRMTVSCGVAGVRESGADYDALHCAADSALYSAKHDGRDRVAVHGFALSA